MIWPDHTTDDHAIAMIEQISTGLPIMLGIDHSELEVHRHD